MLRRQSGRSAAIHLAVSVNRFLLPPSVLVPCVSCAKCTYRGRRFSDILIQCIVGSALPLPQHKLCWLPRDTGIGAAIFPSDTKYLSVEKLVEFLQGLQMTSISNRRPAPIE